MDWRDHIETKPGVMGGRPVIRDTRVTVEILLEWLAAGWSEEEILRNYPRVTAADLRAVHAFARDIIADGLYSLEPRAA
ncbi:MAG: DUF433 domain-containing protein [Sphingomonas sp.]|uniref:DUF433 domain-containing protein n=1 Tax=Sphingomonas sp. TaxID=28214 RepID=UPI0022729A21|nr:DUF433 domain-containing protein [Sphingomonas sp.]MCX8476483.1 DUF433 domain-containing protein [Sphingomonas sp.]